MPILSPNLRTLSIGAGIIATLMSSAAVAEAPRVVATINPVHSLVAAVMRSVAKPYLLLKGGASPHSYSLRPSDARRLSRANLVFWIGEELEAFMEKPLNSLAGKAKVVALHEAKGVHLLKTREGGVWEPHHHHEADRDHDHDKHDADTDHADKDGHKRTGKHEHEHGEYDMHVWLDPHNAEAMVRAIAAALIKVDPDHAEIYRGNADMTVARLEKLEKVLDERLAPVRQRRFIVFHDAYQYFEKRYRLAAAGSITLDPQRQPGAGRVSALRKRLVSGQVRCIFVEPQFPPKLADALIAGTKVKKAVLDPLGADIPEGPDAYFTLLNNIATSLRTCLR